MKRILTLMVGAMALLTVSCSQYKYETVKGDPLKAKIYTLDNGMKVYMTVNKEQPRIQANIAVKVGGKNDPSETTGLAHYFEHLMFKGTPNFGTADYEAEKVLLDQIEALFEVYRVTEDEAERAAIYHQIDSISYLASDYFIPNEYDKLMSFIGSEGTNAYTSTDMTVYVEQIPSNQIENWARIQADRFANPVIRGFHTELETVYEEKNMSLTKDFRKALEAMDGMLFPDHPYGTQTVLGTQEHLKNPSITNIKNYQKTYYVPNNIAICLSGDFDPDEMVTVIEKYFGQMQPNKDLPEITLATSSVIESPVEKDVYGLDAENIMIGWKYPGAKSEDALVAEVAASVLYNGSAGLIDLNINQQQKVLGAYGMSYGRPDAGEFILMGNPKQGQTLEEVRDILLAEVAKLRNGEFDEAVLNGTINNMKLSLMRSLEDNGSRADMFVQSFINGTDWADDVKSIERMQEVTKEDIMNWAGRYLGENSYAIVYKRMGEDKNVIKVTAPKITPIKSNRDKKSAFLEEITSTEVKPIEPSFIDYSTALSQFDVDGLNVVYVQNEVNDLAELYYEFFTGTQNDPALKLAANYLSYLGTPTRSAEEIAQEMYQLACTFNLRSGSSSSFISISGLSENLPEAMRIVEDLIYNAVPDEAILENLKADMLKERADAKLNQGRCFSALQNYILLGKDYIRETTLTDRQIAELTSEELLGKVRNLMEYSHEVSYYGPSTENEVKALIRENHRIAEDLKPLTLRYPEAVPTPSSKVYLAQYDAKQIYYLQYSNNEEKLDLDSDPYIKLYNEYFGGGMNAIVFQEMREARGLAYSASGRLLEPEYKDDSYKYFAFIATQNDKMQTAIEAFDEIINDMPVSETAFNIAKEALTTKYRTERITGRNILRSYQNARDMGITEPRSKKIYEKLPELTLEDVKNTQEKWVKDRTYCYGILGDIKNLDTDYLKTLGTVEVLTLEDIFGY
ncbi:MAG: insulinase family protein [Bacteroidales bacterium]|nr:insulinase family protein [Bacteroidales bacterium]